MRETISSISIYDEEDYTVYDFSGMASWLAKGARKQSITGKRKKRGRPSRAEFAFYTCTVKGCTYTTSVKETIKEHKAEVHAY